MTTLSLSAVGDVSVFAFMAISGADRSTRVIPCRPLMRASADMPVDIIVPVAGAPEAFARCLDSLLTHSDLEKHRLIVVLDGPQPPGMPRLPEQAMVLENQERRG